MPLTFKFALKQLSDVGSGAGARSAAILAGTDKEREMSDGYVTTHVLDAARGCPAEGLAIEVWRVDGDARTLLRRVETNDDGRTDAPPIPKGELAPGVFEFVFHAGAYLDRALGPSDGPRFLDVVPIRFGVADASQHYHVPLLLSPFSYSTYRGS